MREHREKKADIRGNDIDNFAARQSLLNFQAFIRRAFEIAERQGSDLQRSNLYGCIITLAKCVNELRDIDYGLKIQEEHHPVESLRNTRTAVSFKVLRWVEEIIRNPHVNETI